MEKDLHILGDALIGQKFVIAKKVHEKRVAEVLADRNAVQVSLQENEIIKVRADFVSMFGDALKRGIENKDAYKKIEHWGKETGEFIYGLGVPLDEALKDTSYYRTYISKVLEETAIEHDMSVPTVFAAARAVDPLLDHAVYCFSLTYIHFYKKTLEASKAAFLELSVPVVPLSNGTAILPLIGNIDTDRAKHIMEESLNEAVRLKLSTLILDLSGVMIVDTMVADQLFKVIASLRLLGVKSILTGIRPEIAQTVINMGINFKDVLIVANLQQALEELEKQL